MESPLSIICFSGWEILEMQSDMRTRDSKYFRNRISPISVPEVIHPKEAGRISTVAKLVPHPERLRPVRSMGAL